MPAEEFIETVAFGGEEIKDALKWVQTREDKIILAEIKGINQQTRKLFRGSGTIVGVKSGFRRNYLALLLSEGSLGADKLAPHLVLTIGRLRSLQEDIGANMIVLKNTLRKNLGTYWFFDGNRMSHVINYINALKNARIIAYVRGTWVETGEYFYGKGEVFSGRRFFHNLQLRAFFVMEVLKGKAGSRDMAHLAISVGGKSILPAKRRIYREDIEADKILLKIVRKPKEELHYDYILDVRDLTVNYGRKNAAVIENASFKIKEGEILGIVGESGSGKSTIVKAILGDISLNKGSIKICGIDFQNKREISPRVGYVPQDLSRMYLEFTPLENILYFGQQYGINPEELIRRGKQVLRDLGIVVKANIPVGELSGGEQRRASIAIALIHYPKILFLDEPTSGLDPVHRYELWDYLDVINKQYGISLVVITHFPNEADYCDQVAIFMKGKGFIDFGTPSELKTRLPGNGFALEITPEMFDPQMISLLESSKDISFVIQRGENLRIFSEKGTKSILDQCIKVLSENHFTIHQVEPKIEIDMIDLFLYHSRFSLKSAPAT
ncbi:MAG: ABC transporter ATP-binding protein [Candidatus Helarchaeota archaeon]|nr:ABC transporter ATP-binding protein [Candidatus Helarchaeota archaeon]